MLRKVTRERREYIYRKSLEGKKKERYAKKVKIAEALAAGKAIPTELRDDEEQLRRELEIEDLPNSVPQTHIDDEYALAGVKDPKIFITSSRDPSSRLTQFVKEMKMVFPNSERINRGNYVIKDIVEACRANEVTDMIILHEHRGEPDGMIISHLPYGPTAYFGLINTVLRHDLKETVPMSEAYPHLVFDNMTTPLGERVRTILRSLFPVPKEDTKRVITFANQNDFISFRHHIFRKNGKEVDLKEVGPRFEMRLYQIKLGTVDISEAENEWVLRPYLNTAKKRNTLSTS